MDRREYVAWLQRAGVAHLRRQSKELAMVPGDTKLERARIEHNIEQLERGNIAGNGD